MTDKSERGGEHAAKASGEGPGIRFTLAVIGWLYGIAASKGWLALLATIFPPYGWYLAVKALAGAAGLLP